MRFTGCFAPLAALSLATAAPASSVAAARIVGLEVDSTASQSHYRLTLRLAIDDAVPGHSTAFWVNSAAAGAGSVPELMLLNSTNPSECASAYAFRLDQPPSHLPVWRVNADLSTADDRLQPRCAVMEYRLSRGARCTFEVVSLAAAVDGSLPHQVIREAISFGEPECPLQPLVIGARELAPTASGRALELIGTNLDAIRSVLIDGRIGGLRSSVNEGPSGRALIVELPATSVSAAPRVAVLCTELDTVTLSLASLSSDPVPMLNRYVRLASAFSLDLGGPRWRPVEESSIRTDLASLLAQAGVEAILPLHLPAGALGDTNAIGEAILPIPIQEEILGRLRVGLDPAQSLAVLRANTTLIRAASVDLNRHAPLAAPNDPLYPMQWTLHPSSPVTCGSGTVTVASDAGMNAESVINTPTIYPGVPIAILDTGVHPSLQDAHEDLSNCVVDFNFTDDTTSTYAYDNNVGAFHGTNVAGIAAPVTGNAMGVAGVAFSAYPVAIKTLRGNGTGTSGFLVAGINRARELGIRLLNISARADTSGALAAACLLARNEGRLIVASSGNTGTADDAHWPAPARYGLRALAVGATDTQGRRWNDLLGTRSSNYGPRLDLVAPGGHLAVTTDPTAGSYWSNTLYPCTNCYAPVNRVHPLNACDPSVVFSWFFMGTSATAPLVSSVAARLLEQNPDLLGDDIESIFKVTAFRPSIYFPPGQTFAAELGYGRVDAAAAVQLISPPHRVVQRVIPYQNDLGAVNLRVTAMGSTPTLRTLRGVKIGAVWFNGPAYTLQYRVSARASYGDLSFAGPPLFWTRTSGTWGARDTTELNWYDYEVPMARVTGTVAVDTAHCDTYVYQVFSSASLADSIGWWPCRPGEARIAYTAIGVLSGTTDAPTPLNRAGLACPSVVTGRRFVVGLDAPVGVEIRGELLDVLGRRVGDWRERSVHDGLHEYELEAPRAAGVYYLRVRVGGQQHSGRVVVMK